MIQIITYVIVCAFLCVAVLMYHKVRGRTKKVMIEISACFAMFFIVGLLCLFSLNEKKHMIYMNEKAIGEPGYGVPQRLLLEAIPNDTKYQLTVMSIMGDTTFTIILSKEEIAKLKKDLP